ncbi:hypothetical protein NDU88_002308 [Pleurodeles waltl]|uniref:Uncharacterized protein n=1 Tax=Pleurodeles waltl TaxID=8319 RepID=A0AAV7UB02_PLEWA|nr:hypothetical protein NDU88_002308 [Pleurodeles waltl]
MQYVRLPLSNGVIKRPKIKWREHLQKPPRRGLNVYSPRRAFTRAEKSVLRSARCRDGDSDENRNLWLRACADRKELGNRERTALLVQH